MMNQQLSHPNHAPHRTLADIHLGETGYIHSLSPTCHGIERRRFLDLGFTPGTAITAELKSPSGDPIAYRIRGALIALRQEQARRILLESIEETEDEES